MVENIIAALVAEKIVCVGLRRRSEEEGKDGSELHIGGSTVGLSVIDRERARVSRGVVVDSVILYTCVVQ